MQIFESLHVKQWDKGIEQVKQYWLPGKEAKYEKVLKQEVQKEPFRQVSQLSKTLEQLAQDPLNSTKFSIQSVQKVVFKHYWQLFIKEIQEMQLSRSTLKVKLSSQPVQTTFDEQVKQFNIVPLHSRHDPSDR